MRRLSPRRPALLWNLWNPAAPRLIARNARRYMTLRYEDLVGEPVAAVTQVLALIGMPDARLPFVDRATVDLAPNHTVSGNPDRLKVGPITILPATAASKHLRKPDHMLVTALTLPVRVRYGYRSSPASNTPAGSRIGIQHLPEPLRTWRRLQRHLAWAQEDGVARLVEEDQLDARQRLAASMRRREWRRRDPIVPGSTMPLLPVGL